MTAVLHRGWHPDVLVSGLAQLLLTPPQDPFTREVVAVPTRGIERYLSQALARHLGAAPGGHDGICANVSFESPGDLVADAMEVVEGIPRGTDPWRPERLAWPILEVIDRSLGEAWCRPVARHLGSDDGDPPGSHSLRQDRRFALSSRLARLFASYATQRPEMIEAWARGEDSDGRLPLPADLTWQRELWLQVRESVGVSSPAERLGRACDALAADPTVLDLPERISIFGPTRLPTGHLRILASLAHGRAVHLWLTDASPVLWPAGSLERTPGPTTSRSAGSPPAPSRLPANPLLRSLGRDAAELRARLPLELAGVLADPRAWTADAAAGLHSADPPSAASSLLATLQESLRRDAVLPMPRSQCHPIASTDSSVQVHACHGATRQAEVLREVILGLLAADDSLQPRDILVMCPDLPMMAPLITAAFSDADARLAALRVRIADQTPEQGNEVLATLGALLDVVSGRALLSDVLDLLARAPVRTRFNLDDDDVARIEQLAVRAGVRWGLDDGTRESFHLRGVTASTWAWGLDRMLLGAALSEDGLPMVAGTLPLDDVTTSDLRVLGRLAEAIARLTRLRDAAAARMSLASWVTSLEDAVTGLMDARGADSWQVPNALAVIATLPELAGPHAPELPLALADIRWMLAGAIAGRPTRSNFGSGGLTVCGLEPMRSVPHRVVCLVGLDDMAYPRTGRRDGDDILGRNRWVGERDVRSEDRQILLDAVLTAGEHLVITYTGADERTNERRPPCVPVGELLDALDGMARSADGGTAREHVLVSHPLQPFDERNFVRGALVAHAAFSHDGDAFAGALTAREPRVDRPAALMVPRAPVTPPPTCTVSDLVRLLRSPARVFLRDRLGLTSGGGAQTLPESLPLELDALEAWAIGERAVRSLGLGQSGPAFADAERARGCLPPADSLAGPVLETIRPHAEAIAAQLVAVREGPARLVPIRVTLPSGRTLVGSIANVHDSGIVSSSYSQTRLKHLAIAWPEVLALGATGAGPQARITLVGKGGPRSLVSPPQEQALILLDELLTLLDSALASPLPLPMSTSAAYAQARKGGSRVPAATQAALREWRRKHDGAFIGDVTAWESVLLYGEDAPLDAVLAEPAAAEGARFPDDPSRFGTLARTLWEPILSCTSVAP